MTTTPNSPAELVAMNDEPSCPYERSAVQAAMEALSPDQANLGDIQAVAEICISILKDCAKEHSEEEHEEGCDFPAIAGKMYHDLCGAEALLERCGYIAMNDEEDGNDC